MANRTSPPSALSSGKRCLFAAVTLTLPILALVLLELVLRLFGWGGYPPWISRLGPLPSGEEVCIVNAAASKPYFFANPERQGGSTEQSSLLMPKPENTFRIFLVGESAAQGYPQPRNLTMASFLRVMLRDLWPGMNVEVVNLGTTAVASFPLVYQVRDALRFSPDLMVLYVGNNEFFGAYGTASISAVGSLPNWILRTMRAARGLALIQLIDSFVYARADRDRTLMEEMIGRTVVAPDSPLRKAAAANLAGNLAAMVDDIRSAGVPVLVCTTASNEAGLTPLGQDAVDGLPEGQRRELAALLADAERTDDDLVRAELLGRAVALAPRHALAHYRLGCALAALGKPLEARDHFLAARDLDTLPWRPIAETEKAIRDTAHTNGVPLCDIAEIFRSESPGGASGWEWLDDHVHLSLAGQARAARAIALAVAGLSDAGPDPQARLRSDREYTQILGENIYDTYRVDHMMKDLFEISFMKRNNPDVSGKFSSRCRRAEEQMSPGVLAAVREWQSLKAQDQALRPVTSLVAGVKLREGRNREAQALYELAARQIPDYTSWYLEYIYYSLVCRELVHGGLDQADRERAAEAILQGRFLLERGLAGEGGAEAFYVGRLYQLCQQWAEAAFFLQSARKSLQGADRLTVDRALAVSYLKTGQRTLALELCEEGIKTGGTAAVAYNELRAEILRSPAP